MKLYNNFLITPLPKKCHEIVYKLSVLKIGLPDSHTHSWREESIAARSHTQLPISWLARGTYQEKGEGLILVAVITYKVTSLPNTVQVAL